MGQFCTGVVQSIDTRNPKNVMASIKHDKYYTSWYRTWIPLSKLTRIER